MQSAVIPSAIDPPAVSRRPRVLLLSDVQPENSSGGQIVLYRHLVASEDFELMAITPAIPPLFESKAWRRIKNTRLFRLTNTIEELSVSNAPSSHCAAKAKAFSPDVVMTVAHGRGYGQARQLANCLQVPLITIFHDWWPDLDDVLPGWKWLANRRFLKIARQSALCLCVSDQMRTALASPDNTVLLPPIPGPAPPPTERFPANTRLTIGYFGSLYDYGPMMAELAEAASQQDAIKLEIRGTKPNWPKRLVDKYTRAKIFFPFAPRQEFEDWIANLNAILCTMSFDPSLKRRMETSFPSKLIESLQFGKPVIIWGPEYCSAVQWAQANQVGHCITTPMVLEVVAELQAFLRNTAAQRAASQRAEIISKTVFSPQEIHRHFRQELWKVVRRHHRGV